MTWQVFAEVTQRLAWEVGSTLRGLGTAEGRRRGFQVHLRGLPGHEAGEREAPVCPSARVLNGRGGPE